MNNLNNPIIIKKEDAIDILDRTIGFNNNCDNKASFMVGIFGVLLTILFSSEGVSELKNIIKESVKTGSYFYNALLICSAVGFAYGIYKLGQVLFPKTDCAELQHENIEMNSKIFFGSICKNSTYSQYKEIMMNCSEDEYINDIISQIYLNSIICNRKFKNFKIGSITAFIGFFSFLAVWGIGIIFY